MTVSLSLSRQLPGLFLATSLASAESCSMQALYSVHSFLTIKKMLSQAALEGRMVRIPRITWHRSFKCGCFFSTSAHTLSTLCTAFLSSGSGWQLLMSAIWYAENCSKTLSTEHPFGTRIGNLLRRFSRLETFASICLLGSATSLKRGSCTGHLLWR